MFKFTKSSPYSDKGLIQSSILIDPEPSKKLLKRCVRRDVLYGIFSAIFLKLVEDWFSYNILRHCFKFDNDLFISPEIYINI